MTAIEYQNLMSSVTDCSTLEQFIAECGGSAPASWWYPEENAGDRIIYGLTLLWEISRDHTVKTVKEIYGLSDVKLAALFYGAPKNTLRNWIWGKDSKGNDRKVPPHILHALTATVVDWMVSEWVPGEKAD